MFKSNGFTLVELVAVIAMVAILSAIAVPNVVAWRSRAKLNSAVRQVLTDLQMAKMRAVKQSSNVVVDFHDPLGRDYMIFVDDVHDENNNANVFDEGIDTLIKTTAVPEGVRILAARFSGNTCTRFNSQGLPSPMGHVSLINGKDSHTIFVSMTGSLRVETTATGE